MKKLLFCFSFFIFSFSFSYGQSWDWEREGIGHANDYVSSAAVDNAGNAYITGQYEASITFGNYTLITNNTNLYLVKYDPSGNVIWAVQPNDTGFHSSASQGLSVATDRNGNIYVTGYFYGTQVFGRDTLRSNPNEYDVLLVKYNASGSVLWAKQGITSHKPNVDNSGYSVITDTSNNILITGSFSDSITFGSYTLTAPGSSSVFLVKYDPFGNVIWAKQSTGSKGLVTGNSVITDNLNNIYVTGYFSDDSLSFASFILKGSVYSGATFITKYSAAGSVLWAKQNGGPGIPYPNSVVRDGKPNIYLAGYFFDSVKFGPYTLYSPGYNNPPYYSSFLVKYDSAGNVIWAEQSSIGMDAVSMASDGAHHIYMEGITTSNNIYQFGKYALYPAYKQDTVNFFLLKFDSAGTAVCGSLIGGQAWGQNKTGGIAANYVNDSNSYVYMSGTYATNFPMIFLGRWNECPTDAGISEVKAESEMVKVYPNPSSGIFQLEIRNYELGINNIVEVYNILGEKVYSKFLIPNSQFLIDLNSQPNGIYLYRVISETGNLIREGKLIIQK